MQPTDTTSFDGIERELETLAENVHEAEAAIRQLLAKEPERAWTIRELQDTAADMGTWTSSVVSIAYRRLLRLGDVLDVGDDLRVRAL